MRIAKTTIVYLFLLLGVAAKSQGIRSVCYNDSIVTVSFDDFLDPCGSHVHRILYGSIDNGPFLPYDTIFNLNSNQMLVKLFNDLPDVDTKRSFFITTFYGCGGTDTLNTDTVFVDQQQPDDLQIDSVSVDIATQQVLIGWTRSQSADTEGYRIYEYNNAVYSLIDETPFTQYSLTGTTGNQTRTYGLAAYDSCRNFSPFLDRHKPIHLQLSFDTCSRQIDLSWTSYEGFPTDDYKVIQNLNNSGWTTLHTQAGNSANYNSLNPQFDLGDTVCLAVRTNNAIEPSISTTSNVLCVHSRELEKPLQFELTKVTVLDDRLVEVHLETNVHPDYPIANIYRGSTPNNLTIQEALTIGTNNLVWEDNTIDVDEEIRYYSLELLNKCNETILWSDTSRNVRLQLDDSGDPLAHSWNKYTAWSTGVNYYDLEESTNNGFTWNIVVPSLTPTTTNTHTPTPTESADPCYRIVGYRSDGVFTRSNWTCSSAPFRVWIPNGVNPKSENNRFNIVTTGVDLENSRYQIYTRWGQRIYSSSLASSWDLTYNNSPVPPGVYLYVVDVLSQDGQRQQFNGEVVVLQ